MHFTHGTRIMAIINATPDSFSDGGLHYRAEDAIAYAHKAIEDGADILDIGGESTRPGHEPVSVEEECRRVMPIVEALRQHTDIPISIDTTKAAVAETALQAGADIINDISGMAFDDAMPAVVANYHAACVLMHTPPANTMHTTHVYQDVADTVSHYLLERTRIAEAAGILRERIMWDPGFGFGKNVEQNLALLHQLPRFVATGYPILVGISRKRTVKMFTGPDVEALDHGSSIVHAFAATHGAQLVRVHNVRAAKAALAMRQALLDPTRG